jgi:intracellular sulfur oxidation DsrE/DsrF family protein
MNRRKTLGIVAGALAAAPVLLTAARAAEPSAKPHRIAIQVSANDAATMNLALNNAKNVIEYYAARHEEVAVEIVAYGPGLHMLRADTSPVKDRLQSVRDSMPQIRFSACDNTKRGMEKTEGKEITLVPGAVIVPAGVVRLMELQEQGWSYIRP